MPTQPSNSDLAQIKDYFNLAMSNLADRITQINAHSDQKLDRLTRLVEQQGQTLNQLQLQTSNSITALQADVKNLYEEVDAMKKAINSVSQRLEGEVDVRQLADKSISDKIQAIKDADVAKWQAQQDLNKSFSFVIKLMWFVAGLVLTQIVLLFWNVLVAGGLQNYLNQFRGGP